MNQRDPSSVKNPNVEDFIGNAILKIQLVALDLGLT